MFDVRDPLLAAVLAEPDSDAARRAYAEANAGTPHAELIALQLDKLRRPLSGDELRTESQLIERHGWDWIGPLAPVLRGGFTFERGFLAACSVPTYRQTYNIQRVVGHPVWATVQEFSGPPLLFCHPAMRSLRALTIQYYDLPALNTREVAAGVEALVIDGSPADEALGLCPPRPALRSLTIRRARRDPEFAGRALGAGLAEHLDELVLQFNDPPRHLGAWVRAMNRAAHVPTVVLDGVGWHGGGPRYEFSLTDAGYSSLHLHIERLNHPVPYRANKIAEEVLGARALIRSASVSIANTDGTDPAGFAAIQAAVDRIVD